MQDIVFYVAAKETLGKVRDYSNMRNSDAPLLTLGVAVCLRMRLFDDIEDSTPYPIASFSGIADWQWRMDADFDRSTACKLVADADGISVHTVTDTVKGETMSFTEFVIPISNMNTEELVAWLGSDKVKTGLAGELVGYDDEGHASFVLQIEDFSVRNRLAGLNDEDEDDPTPVDQEIVTRPVAEQMIQTAISAFDASKQDKLTSGNAGTGITISNAGVISADNVPQSAVTGLVSELSGKQNTLSTGFWIEIDDDWISVERYHTIYGPYSSGTVTMLAGEAYKIYAVNSVVTLNKGSMPSNTWGMESHLEVFVGNTGYVQTGENVVLANALEPDAVNNCTVRFHDGYAIISVEDHVAGYVVVTASGTTAGTLPYALHNVSSEYIAFDATTNGQIIDLSGTTTYAGEKHIVGNGYTETILSGGINCTSKTTFANLGMNGVVISSGTLTMGDVYIPNGATVSVSGGGLAVEKVTGAGADSLIDFGRTRIVTRYVPAIVSNCQLKNGYIYPDYDLSYSITDCALTDFSTEQANVPAYALSNRGNAEFVRCLITGNTAYMGAIAIIHNNCNITLTGCTFSNNSATYYRNAFDLNLNKGTATVTDCIFANAYRNVSIDSASCTFSGTNSFAGIVIGGTASSLLIASGAIVDLTGNSNATPIAPSGTITFASGGATVKVGNSMASSSYMMDNVTLPAGAKLTNTNVVNLGSANCTVSSGTTASVSGATITSGFAPSRGGFANVLQGTLNVTDCTITGCTAVIGAGINASAGTVNLSGAIFSGNVETDIYGYAGTFTYINGGCTIGVIRSGDTGANWIFTGTNSIGKIETGSGAVVISSGASINLTSSINPGGGITFESGGATIVYSNGASSLKLGDYKVKSIESGGSVVLSGVQATDGVASGGTLTMPEGATAVYVAEGKHLTFSDCVASVYFAPNGVTAMGSYTFGGACYIQRVNKAESIVISSGAVLSLGYGLATESSGGIQVTGGTCTVNGVIVESGAYTSIDSNGSATL